MKNLFYYNYPVIGGIGIIEENRKITGVFFKDVEKASRESGEITIAETALIKKTAQQLDEYFKGKRKIFDIPLELKGTAFQLAVWKALQKIPYGKTKSYKDIAAMAGNAKACRAAGMANNRNPVAIIIPCHRVIGADGSLTGYGGGLDKKEYLLKLENPNLPLNQ